MPDTEKLPQEVSMPDTQAGVLREFTEVTEGAKLHTFGAYGTTSTTRLEILRSDKMADEIVRLRTLLASLAADAGRWRFVREGGAVAIDEDGHLFVCATLFEPEELDEDMPDYAATPQPVKDHITETEGSGYSRDPERVTALLDAAMGQEARDG
jgi:hypothetical protein